ncbi:MAG: DUF2958 domain-containing protein [Acidobacteria bacterium]|nr:DUF2958 domain-containing protein [Acidobacteriota bacterium]
MKLLTESQRRALRANAALVDADPEPVVKFFNPLGAARWLFTELHEDGDTLFGLNDHGFGFPELGYCSLSDIAGTRLPWGLKIERDLHFRAKAPLSVYAEAARHALRIVESGPEFDGSLKRHTAARRNAENGRSAISQPGR